jgi:hypothetical protein
LFLLFFLFFLLFLLFLFFLFFLFFFFMLIPLLLLFLLRWHYSPTQTFVSLWTSPSHPRFLQLFLVFNHAFINICLYAVPPSAFSFPPSRIS